MPDSVDPTASDDIGDELQAGSTTGPPRWVKVFGIIAIVLALLIVVLLIGGGGTGGHGPARHMPSGAPTESGPARM